MSSLVDRTVLITGAARGIGRACAVACAAEGADVALMDIGGDCEAVPYQLGSISQLHATADQCRSFGASALVLTGDVRSSRDCCATVQRTLERYGKCDALINSAGIAAPSGSAVHEMTESQWSLMLDVNLSGAWRMIHEVAPAMIHARHGSVVNVASTAGLVAYRNFAAYVAAKHGLVGLSKAAALDLAPFRIRVNALCPGSVRDTEATEGRMLREIAKSLGLGGEDHEAAFIQSQPMNSLIEPQDVADAAVWLVSDGSTQMTGTALPVDGGFSAK
ncbi:SDR family oxidoreductase [Rhodococcus sp. HNM0563]|uniref:SDR family oxidoreductase n=1 Tax=Rhodococcus sp. HNM0563 TaxID=2716339 RepID=UPI00146BB3E9|nr:SDR family oxidoreductase [Rhodococcus sp. HNM0563]NLU65617.1 SDR family oxidoreductase [Rhodococcus sp. HNM0563]